MLCTNLSSNYTETDKLMSISSTIKSVQDIMRKDVGVDGDAQRLSQLVWILFLKIFDDRERSPA